MTSPSESTATDASFSTLIEGHGDIVGRHILDLSEGAFATFAVLCRTTRDAVPRAEVAASLPGHLDAALRRNDEPAARRLAGEAMRRVARNCRTLAERLKAMDYPAVQAGRAHARNLGYMFERAHDRSDAAVQRKIDAVLAKLDAARDEGKFSEAQLEGLKGDDLISRFTDPDVATQLLDGSDPDKRLPLMLEEFLTWVGRVRLMDPRAGAEGYAHVAWWKARHPEVLVAEAPLVFDRDILSLAA